MQITSSTGTCALAQQKKPCSPISEPLATSTPIKESSKHHQHTATSHSLNDSGYFEPQRLDHLLGITAEHTGHDHSYQLDRWHQKPNDTQYQHQHQQPQHIDKTWSETAAYCNDYQTTWPLQTAWHNHGPLTYPSSTIDQRCHEPMMFYSWDRWEKKYRASVLIPEELMTNWLSVSVGHRRPPILLLSGALIVCLPRWH